VRPSAMGEWWVGCLIFLQGGDSDVASYATMKVVRYG